MGALIIFSLLACSALKGLALRAGPPETLKPLGVGAERPLWKLGDWIEGVYMLSGNRFRLEVIEVRKDGYILRRTEFDDPERSGTVYFTKDLNPVARKDLRGHPLWAAKPYVPYFKWPLTVFKEWSGEYEWLPDKKSYGLTTRVGGYERVPTPAGKLDAFRLEVFPKGKEIGRRGIARLWYSPKAKRIIRAEFDLNREESWVVTSFDVAPEEKEK